MIMTVFISITPSELLIVLQPDFDDAPETGVSCEMI